MKAVNARRLSLAALLSASLAACYRSHPANVTPVCAPVESPLPATTDPGMLAGVFDATFVASSGARASAASVTARLVLRPQSPALVPLPGTTDTGPTASQPVIGTSDLDPATLGGVAMGDLASRDSLGPGVAAYASRHRSGDVASLVLRFGSISNTRGAVAYDAGHFTVYVRRLDPTGFAGGWTSSSGSGFPVHEASGYVCAIRVG